MLKKSFILVLLIASLSLAACAGGSDSGSADGLAVVYEVQLITLESFPVQIQAMVRGNLPDACTQLGEISQSFDEKNKALRVRIAATRPADAVCAQMLSPFEVTIPLEVYGLPAGTYTADVNGVFAEFTLGQDNIIPTPQANIAPPTQDSIPPTSQSNISQTPQSSIIPAPPLPSDLAMVSGVELLMLESFPVQVNAIVRGDLPDSCTQLGAIAQEFDLQNHRLRVRISTTRPVDMMCAQVMTPFEVTIPLNVIGLSAGTYTADVNGVFAEFTLGQDNVLPTP